jgi:hypothetical protein
MNFLAPLFLLGALAVALPILFHLIRRTERERIPFSSLMFLFPTPPRITRRSRLEHIFLLLLRCLILCLLALGFARPFLQRSVPADSGGGVGKRVVLLVDTSASMRREDLWREARAKAEAVLKTASPADQVSVFTFDRQVNRRLLFEQWSATPANQRVNFAVERLAAISPGWSATHLGQALVDAAETVEETREAQQQKQIVLISDLQSGSRLDLLQGYEWPKDIELIVEPLGARRPSNAGLQLVTERDGSEQVAENGPRVRISNSADSTREQFQVGWAGGGGKGFIGAALDVYVPPGQSRVVQAPVAPAGAQSLMLTGDDNDFDNVIHVIHTDPAQVNISYLGSEAENDSAQPLFFLKRAFQQTRRQNVQLIVRPASASLGEFDHAPLIIVTDLVSEDRVRALREAMTAGKTVLFVLKNTAMATTVAGLCNTDRFVCEEAVVSNYAMLGQIEFAHPLFAPFADPRYSDFTKIHFWKHRRVEPDALPGARVLARFDNNDPALIHIPIGKGALLVLTAGWHPADSQLALSSKFVPLLYSMLDLSGGVKAQAVQHFVGDTIAASGIATNGNGPVTVRKPDGTRIELPVGEPYSQTDLPGIYTLTSGQTTQQFAINLDPAESQTAPIPIEELARLGLPLKYTYAEAAHQAAKKRERLLAAELEKRQKLWRWLLACALALLIAETGLAGWITRRATVRTEAPI